MSEKPSPSGESMNFISKHYMLSRPKIADDAKRIDLNGLGNFKYALPGVECNVCGEAWTGHRILPFSCPETFQKNKYLTEPCCISLDHFNKLKQSIENYLIANGLDIELLPGDSFLPMQLKFSSEPISDFLWPSPGTIVVPGKVRELFMQSNITGMTYCESVVQKVGDKTRGMRGQATEPEDSIDLTARHKREIEFSPLFQLVLTSPSVRPVGFEVISKCEACGFEEFSGGDEEVVLDTSTPLKSDIFQIEGSLYIAINQKLADLIVSSKLTNCEIHEIAIN